MSYPVELLARLGAISAENPDQVAVSNETTVCTFGELSHIVETLVKKLGSSRDTRTIYIASQGGPHATAMQIAVMASGNVAVPISCKTTCHEASHYFRSVKPDLLLVDSFEQGSKLLDASSHKPVLITCESGSWSKLIDPEQEIPESGAESQQLPRGAAMIQFTSGSTGNPKAIVISGKAILANLDLNSDLLASSKNQHSFCPIPQSHAMGNAVVLERVFHGSPIHMANSFLLGEHKSRIQRFGCSEILASPSYFRILCGKPNRDFCSGIQSITVGTDRIEKELIEMIQSTSQSARIVCRYGLSEAFGALANYLVNPNQSIPATGTIGHLISGVEAAPPSGKAIQSHEFSLLIKSPTTAMGAIDGNGRFEKLTDNDGFLNTGDLVRHDKKKGFILVGRTSQFIKRNGFRINPFEIEEVLKSVSGVQNAVVIGIPEDGSGQKIVACIEPVDGGHVEEKNLLMACMKNLGQHKVPGEFRFDLPIPKTSSGKPARATLSELITSNA